MTTLASKENLTDDDSGQAVYKTEYALRSVDNPLSETGHLLKPGPGDDKTIGTGQTSSLSENHTDVEIGDVAVPVLGSREEAALHVLTGVKLVLLALGMLSSLFLVALDQTIVATAIPRIASDFHALERVNWIASSYYLTQAGLIVTYGKLLSVATTKWVYIMAITLFEVGSLICGVSPNINLLIFGRALSGVGAAGIFVSAFSIMARVTTLQQRPIIFAIFGSVFAVSSVMGPLLGGLFTQYATWRWCFYINLPFGAITVMAILFIIKPEHSIPPVDSSVPTWKRVARLDWIGSVLSLGTIASLLLPLQWGGVTKAWSDVSVVVAFVVFAILVPTFIAWEWYRGDTALMPLELWKRRTQIGCCIEAFCNMLVLLTVTYYLPLYYQSAQRKSAAQSAIDILTFTISVPSCAMVVGAIIRRVGLPKPFLVFPPLLAAVGAGLMFMELTSNNVNSRALYGYQLLLGLGVGGALQNTIIMIQAEYHDNPRLVPQSTSLVNFTSLTGGMVGIAAAGAIFDNKLSNGIARYAPNLPSNTAADVRQSVAVIYTLTGEDQAHVIHAYSEALGYVFLLAIPAALAASLSGMLVRHHNLVKMNRKAAASNST